MSVYGYAGPDTLIGGTNDDYIHGDGGSDTMKAGRGDDILSSLDGISGNDALFGGGGGQCDGDAGGAESSC